MQWTKLLELFIKNKTGKGPKYVKAFDALTQYEKTLLENSKNNHLVDFSREAFCLDRDKEIEQIVGEVVKSECFLENVIIDLLKLKDKIIISIK